MRLINPNDMVRALQSGAVRQWEYLLYGTLWVVGSVVCMWLLYVSEYSSDLLKYIDCVVTLFMIGGGTLLSWHINKKGDGKDFWKRYFSIDISLAFFAIILVVLTVFPYALIRAFMSDGAYFDQVDTDTIDVVFTTVMDLIFLVWSLSLMRKVSHTTSNPADVAIERASSV